MVDKARVIVWRNVERGGEGLVIDDNTPTLAPPLRGEVSSLLVRHNEWAVFWESDDYKEGDDQLWVEGPRYLNNLHVLYRPHGNNHWGDRIKAVSFPGGGPTGSDEKRTVIYKGTAL